ncbi:MAG: PH domain-containing protein [Bryobacteraceae bacterium]
MLIRPTFKFIRLGYALAGLVVLAAVVAWATVLPQAWWLPIAAAALLLWPLQKHIKRNLTSITIAGDKLRYETGLLSKTTRTIQLSKVQDVRVDQNLGQRILGVGNLSIETAGETSRLTIANIDAPQRAADHIVDLAQHGSAKGQGQGA